MNSLTAPDRPVPETEASVEQSSAPVSATARVPARSKNVRWAFLFLAAAIVAVLAAVAVVSFLRPAAGIEASGTIEAIQSDVASKVQGRLLQLRVRDGDMVKKGQVLAVLERRDPALSVDQARANVAAATAQVAAAQAAYEVQQTTYATTLAQASAGVSIAGSNVGQAGENLDIETDAASIAVDQAHAQIAAAQAAYDHASIDRDRASRLVATGDLARQALNDAQNAYASGAAQLQAAKDALALAQVDRRNIQIRRLGVLSSRSQHRQSLAVLASAQGERALVDQRQAQVLAAQGQLAQARAALALAADQVRETQLVAPFDGYVISHNFEVGDLVQPDSAVMTVGDLAHPYVNVYVSETDLPHIKTGMRVGVTIDGMPGRTFTGTVTEISNTSEFTPENVQTKQERIEYLVFRVKIQFADTTGTLKPGLPADAVIRV
jgi:multidrug resistance efflux pump